MFSLLCHTIFFLIVIIFHGDFVLSQSHCRSSCGNLEIKFPFWLDVSNTSAQTNQTDCGHPGLRVTCENEIALLHAGNDIYVIDAANYSANVFTFKDLDLQNTDCPRARHNVTLNIISPLEFRDNGAVYFYFNCSETIRSGKLLGCLEEEEGQSYGILGGQGESESKVDWRVCEELVVSPVKKNNIPTGNFDLGSTFTKMLHGGFEMVVTERELKKCSDCEGGMGTCAYVRSQGTYTFNCLGKLDRRRDKTMKIIVGVSAGFGGILLATVFFFLYKRKGRKMQPNTSKLLSWTNSSELSQKKDLENGDDSISSPLFRYEELLDATDGFSPSNELGDGGFGTVYKGKLRDGRIVAVKRLYENNYKRVEQFRNEVDILNGLRHPNLVSLYGCTSRHSRELLLVYEFVPNGTIADHLHGHLASSFKLNWALRLRVAQETAAALAYLHATEPPIIHRDVKTNNILLDANFHVKVADFGLSRLFPLDVTHVSTAPQGTPGYVDPEYHQCYQLTDKSDVYSFGVVLVELISSKPAVDITRGRNEINLSNMAINKIQSGQLGELVDPGLGFESDMEVRRTVEVVAELAFRCLQSEKDMRPSMEDAVEVLSLVGDGGRERETEVEEKKTDEMVLLKALGPPLSPNSVTYIWSSKVTTPNISE